MRKQVPLAEMASGRTALVVEIQGGKGVHDRLRALGIRPGVSLKKISGRVGRGPAVVRQGQTQTALGGGICEKIIVEVEE
jgi:ferrous iron transport protein A